MAGRCRPSWRGGGNRTADAGVVAAARRVAVRDRRRCRERPDRGDHDPRRDRRDEVRRERHSALVPVPERHRRRAGNCHRPERQRARRKQFDADEPVVGRYHEVHDNPGGADPVHGSGPERQRPPGGEQLGREPDLGEVLGERRHGEPLSEGV